MVAVAGVGEQGQEEEFLERPVSGTDVDVVRRYLVDHAQRCVPS